jgi:hypothetical protein
MVRVLKKEMALPGSFSSATCQTIEVTFDET